MNLETLLNKTLSEVALLTQSKTRELIKLLKKAGIKATTLTKLEEAHLPFIQKYIEQKTSIMKNRGNKIRKNCSDTTPKLLLFTGKTISELAKSLNLTTYFVISKIRPREENISASTILTQSHLRILAPQLEHLNNIKKREEKRQKAEALTVKKETKSQSVKSKRRSNKLTNYPSNQTSIKIIYTGHPKS